MTPPRPASTRGAAAGLSRAAPLPAYVLHHWAWSETSLIVDLYTRDEGRLAVVAKGAKRPYSQLRSVLLPFQRVHATLARRKAEAPPALQADDGGEILTLKSAEYAGGARPLPPQRLVSGFYLNELLMKLLPRQDPHAALFDAYADALAALAEAGGDDDDAEAALRAFELQLLRETGVLPELDRGTPTQEPLQPARGYALRADSGLVAAAPGEAALDASRWQALHDALVARDGGRLRAATRVVLPALKGQLRGLLHYHLGSPHLRTRDAMLEIRSLFDPDTQGRPR